MQHEKSPLKGIAEYLKELIKDSAAQHERALELNHAELAAHYKSEKGVVEMILREIESRIPTEREFMNMVWDEARNRLFKTPANENDFDTFYNTFNNDSI